MQFSALNVYKNHLNVSKNQSCRSLGPRLSNLTERLWEGSRRQGSQVTVMLMVCRDPVQKSCTKGRYVIHALTSLLLYVLKISSQRKPSLVLWYINLVMLPFLSSFLLRLQMNIKVNLMGSISQQQRKDNVMV